MRIAYVSAPWLPVPPPGYGGSEAVIDLLARGARAVGHEVLLFTTGDSRCPVERRWVRAQAVPEQMGESSIELAHVIAAYAAAREWGAHIVHDHTMMGPAYARHLTGPPRLVTTHHGPFTDDACAIYRDAAQHAAVVAISHAQAASAGDIPIARVIHHGIDPAEYPIGKGEGGFFLFLGRMCADKGVLEAVLIARAAGIRLLIAAKMREPNEQAYFASQVQPLLTDKIQFIGEVAGDRKVQLLGAATGLLNPLCWPEPFGLAMIEALACGTPVVTYPLGSAPEIVRDGVTGFLCRDEGYLIGRLADVQHLDRRACRRAVEEHFNQQRMVRDHVQLYTELRAHTGPQTLSAPRLRIVTRDCSAASARSVLRRLPR